MDRYARDPSQLPSANGMRSPEYLERLMYLLSRVEGQEFIPGSTRDLNLTDLQWANLELAIEAYGHPLPIEDGQVRNNGHVDTEDEEEAEPDESGVVEPDAEAEEDAISDTSSAMYDPEADPDAYARRLDELAGVLEMGEEEARAMRWGMAVGKTDRSILSIEDFKAVINHHLTATEWKYTSDTPFRHDTSGRSLTDGTEFERHPIWIVGPNRDDDSEDKMTSLPHAQDRDESM